ncbi:unnamed protein product, partial [Sphagnum compactum]
QSDQKWTCDVCDKVFKKRIDLKFHHKFCNSDKGPPSCEFCSKRFKTWKSVRNHKRLKHEKEIRFTCEICGFGTQRQETLNRHIFKTHFGNPRPFICDICNKRFPSKGSISYHIQLKHLNLGNHICEVCSMKFIAKSSLDAHILAKHTTEKNYSCPECPKQFKSAQHVKAHLYKVHIPTELKPRYTCNQCEYVTHDKKSFNNHEILHRDDREKPHQCKYCSKGFVTLNNQLRHEMTHTNERPYDCEVCGKSFRAKADLKVHSRYHTGLHILKVHYDNPRPYTCDICNSRFPTKAATKYHIQLKHLDMGRFQCDVCLQKFMVKSSLDAHVLTKHTTERTHECQQCSKKFKTEYHLKGHMYKVHVPPELKPQYSCENCEYVTHDKKSYENHKFLHIEDHKKPFQCKFCSKGFTSQSHHQRHEMMHTNE